MADSPQVLWTDQGLHCEAVRTAAGFEVHVRIGVNPPFIRKTAHSKGDARNQGEYLRMLLDRSREAVPQVRARPPLVLLVEDDPDNLLAYEEMIRIENLRSASAPTLADARRLAREVKPDAVLLDHILPDGEGTDICTELRDAHGSGELPIILVTGLGPERFRLGSRDCPDAVLTKPCRPDTMIAVLKLVTSWKKPEKRVPASSAHVRDEHKGRYLFVRCPLCGTPGAELAARGAFLCHACGREGVLPADQFVDSL